MGTRALLRPARGRVAQAERKQRVAPRSDGPAPRLERPPARGQSQACCTGRRGEGGSGALGLGDQRCHGRQAGQQVVKRRLCQLIGRGLEQGLGGKVAIDHRAAAIHDQMGNTQQARDLYNQALRIAPDEPSLLNNLAMSYLLEGEAKEAESVLRRAAASPKADSRIRQNLALAIGLQGRFQEAEQIAKRELSPEQAQANVAYLRSMLSQDNAWSQLENEERSTN